MNAPISPAQWLRNFYERRRGAWHLRVTLSKAYGPYGDIRRHVVVFRARRNGERIREAAFELPELRASLLSETEINAAVEQAFTEARQVLVERSPTSNGGNPWQPSTR